jgi:radical SAM superfamily enzyme YgiQ (UPF0313 family)
MDVVLVNPYELGRQPFGLAEPAALLQREGARVDCLDLSIERLDPKVLRAADLVAVYVAMHTATRIAIEALSKIRELAPKAHICVYGLYAPMNEGLLRSLGVETVLGGEFEPGLVSLVRRMGSSNGTSQIEPVIDLSKVSFLVPDRSKLPGLSKYAHLILPDGTRKTVGFVEASRGCKHLCRHCPVVPVYQGRFRIIPRDIVSADIRNQVAAGAEHLSFGDPDFFNGPTHAIRIVQALHQEFPEITYDATIKIEHIIKHRDLLQILKETGCRFITSAVESLDDDILRYFDKNHSSADFRAAVQILNEIGIDLAPTFVPFTPWTTLEGYIKLLEQLVELRLVQSIPPIQLAIRLLVPEGSYLLTLPGFGDRLGPFDPGTLGYPWAHEDARVDRLQDAIQAFAAEAEQQELSRRATFARIWSMAHDACEVPAPVLNGDFTGRAIAHMSEPWYCCAEPTNQQLAAF